MGNPPKTAVIGAHGLVGRTLLAAYRDIYSDVVGTDWQGRDGLIRLDLGAPDTFPANLGTSGHTWAVICAGIRDYKMCETQKTYTRDRNVTATLALARHLRSQGLKVALFSSDAVYGGETGGYSEDSTPSEPVNEYARQKCDLESALRKDPALKQCLVLRIGRVIGTKKGDETLLDTIAQSLVSGQAVQAARDQIFTPILVDDLPRVLMTLQSLNVEGALNVAGPEASSRLQIARRLADGLGCDRSLVREVSLENIGGGFARPKNISMKCDRLSKLMPFSLTSVSSCLEQVIRNYSDTSKKGCHEN